MKKDRQTHGARHTEAGFSCSLSQDSWFQAVGERRDKTRVEQERERGRKRERESGGAMKNKKQRKREESRAFYSQEWRGKKFSRKLLW